MRELMIFKALVGDVNYNLPVGEVNSSTKFFLLPDQERPEDTLEVTYHTIEELSEGLCQSQLAFIETLFSEGLTFSRLLEAGTGSHLMQLFEYREEIARANCQALYQNVMNQFDQLVGELSQTILFNQTAMKAAGLLDLLIRYAEQSFTEFKLAMWLGEDEFERIELQRIASGAYTQEEMFQYLSNKKAYLDTHIQPLYVKRKIDNERLTWVRNELNALKEAYFLQKMS